MRSGFFDNTDVTSADFSAAFAGILTNGVAMAKNAGAMLVTASSGMTVSVAAGYCWINGYFGLTATAETITLELADGTYSRIDRIVLRLDISNGNIHIDKITGTAAASPVAPEIVRNGSYYDLCIADITVAAGIVAIATADIIDKRADDTLCGVVQNTAANFDVETLLSQWSATFSDWFVDLKNQLDTNQAAHLQNEIDQINARLDGAVMLHEDAGGVYYETDEEETV